MPDTNEKIIEKILPLEAKPLYVALRDIKTYIPRIKKIYDISAVSFPANPGTEIGVSYRDYFNGVIEAERAERLEAEKKARAKARLMLKLRMEEHYDI